MLTQGGIGAQKRGEVIGPDWSRHVEQQATNHAEDQGRRPHDAGTAES